MIHRVEFHNFKALRNVAFDLERLTALVGPNASGKTSALEGLHYLSALGPDKTWQDLFGDEGDQRFLVSSGVKNTMSLQAWGREGSLRVATGPKDSSVTFKNPEGLTTGSSCGVSPSTSGRTSAKTAAGTPDESVFPPVPIGPIPSSFGPSVFLRLDVKQLSSPSYSEQAIPQMQPDGEGLPSVLAYLASNRPDEYQRLLEALREVIPIVRAMRFPRASVTRLVSEVIEIDGKQFTHRGDREYWGNSIEFDMDGAEGIPAYAASEGTLLVLGLLTVIMGPNRPRVVLLDDVDRALHPKAQEDLVSLLRKLLDQNPDMQIVATSHSPYLLDHLKPEEVRLTTLRDDGSVACGRLDEHPEFGKWKEEMTPGEFWSLVGEKWLVEATGGDPA